jgi:hypothetical protein
MAKEAEKQALLESKKRAEERIAKGKSITSPKKNTGINADGYKAAEAELKRIE